MKARSYRARLLAAGAGTLALVAAAGLPALGSTPAGATATARTPSIASPASTPVRATTPIKHVVVIFQENVSFDHYFGTYPKATDTGGEPFHALPGTPHINGLSGALLTHNPNGVNPHRFNPKVVSDVLTCDENHGYTTEQYAENGGKMNRFTAAGGTAATSGTSPTGTACKAADVMGYYDGNTVTALWNYAQHFAMSDASYGTNFGPSTVGAVNLVSGQTGDVDPDHAVGGSLTDGDVVPDGLGGYTNVDDPDPYYDDCAANDRLAMTGQNVGDQLNAKGLSWGWFEGGFTPTKPYTGRPSTTSNYNVLNVPGRAACGAEHPVGAALGGTGQWGTKADYIPHHNPFQYYASTANPHHLAPTSLSVVGTDTATPGEFNTANHNYDLTRFNALVAGIKAGKLAASHFPAVTFLKASGYQDGHAGYSDPIDEQVFLVKEINAIESLPTWKSTAIFISYDDSDGWYDHAYGPIVNTSHTADDALTGTGACGSAAVTPIWGAQGRCGYGPRLPLLVISPYARANFVAGTVSDQSSILKFIEDNWKLGEIGGSMANIAGSLDNMFDFSHPRAKPLYLNPLTGEAS